MTNETAAQPVRYDYATCALSYFGAGSGGCGNPLPPGITAGTAYSVPFNIVLHDGSTRQYLLYIPSNYSPTTPAPLVIAYHGNGDTGLVIQGDSGWATNAANPNYIAVFPYGVGGSWQGAPYSTAGIDDIAFTRFLLANLTSTYCVDPTRVFAAGHSNGGGFVGTMACDPIGSRMFAAYAANSGAFYPMNLGYTSCNPSTVYQPCAPYVSRRLPFLEIHGNADPLINYTGGAHNGECMATVQQYVAQWVVRDGFATNTTSNTIFAGATQTNVSGGTLGTAIQYQFGTSGQGIYGNPGGVFGEVEHYQVPGGGHQWQKIATTGFSTSVAMMNFFSQWTLFTG